MLMANWCFISAILMCYSIIKTEKCITLNILIIIINEYCLDVVIYIVYVMMTVFSLLYSNSNAKDKCLDI